MNISKVLLFLGLTFGLSILSLFLPGIILEEGSLLEPILKLLMYCWAPAAAAIITQKYIYKGSMARYGWNRKHFSFSWIALTLFLPLGIIAATVFVVYLLGNVMGMPDFGVIILGDHLSTFTHSFAPEILTLDGVIGEFAALMLSIVPFRMPPEVLTLFLVFLIGGLIGGTTINLLFNVGEEIGWRGFMLAETRSLGFMGSNLIIGVLWGLWYIPLLFDVNAGASSAVLGDMLALVGFMVSISFLMAYLAVKTRSVYASATFHGVLNNVAILGCFFIWEENPLFGSVKGLAGMVVFLFLTLLIIWMDKTFVDKYRDQAY